MQNIENLFCIFSQTSFHFTMIRLAILLTIMSALIYIDRFALDSNIEVSSFLTEFALDEKCNAIVNLTMHLNKTLTKALLYVKVNLAENEHDRDCKRKLVRTVFNTEKLYDVSQMNPFAVGSIENLRRFLDFDIRFPLQPVGVYELIVPCFVLMIHQFLV